MTNIRLAGYQEFQRRLILEVKDGDRSPVEVHAGGRNVEGSYLGDFLAKASAQMPFARDAITDDDTVRRKPVDSGRPAQADRSHSGTTIKI